MDINTDLPLGYTIISFILSLVVVVFLYRKAKRFKDISFAQRLFPAVMRAMVIFILAFFLLGPTLKYIELKFEKPILLVANDVSISMQKDSSRQDQWIREFKEQSQFDNLEVKYVNFGSQVLAKDAIGGFEAIRQKTSISELSSYVENNFEGRNLAGILIATDGVSNSGLNPLYASMVQQAPIFTIGFGDTTQFQDVAIVNLQYNDLARLNAKSPINFDVKTKGLKGETIVASMYSGSKKIKEQNISISTNNSFEKLQWEVELKEAGIKKFRIELESKVGEVNNENNVETFFIDVQEVHKKVLLLAAVPHPDVTTIATSISDQFGIQVDVRLATDGKPESNDYQLVILHQLPQSGKAYPWLKDLINSKVGLWFIVGSKTNLIELDQLQDWVDITSSRGNPDEIFPVLNTAFSPFQLDAETAKAFKVNKPMLKPNGTYKIPSNVDVLLFQKIGNLLTPYPLMFSINDGNRKLGFLLAEGIWMSKLGEQQQIGNTNAFNNLLKKWVNYLSIIDKQERLVVASESRYLAGDGIAMTARYYNASFELDDAVNITIDFENEVGDKFAYNFRPVNNSFLLQAKGLPIGSYSYKVGVEGQSPIYKNGAFVIEENNLELQDLQANHSLLKNLAQKSNGAFYAPSQVTNLIADITASKTSRMVQYEELVFKNLLDFYWLFYLLLGLLSIEWAWRKWLGMI
ncbi:MAG: hypothetical protein ACI8ZO_001034 [Flavobacteriales bacterium]|jgi:hypothetical protein